MSGTVGAFVDDSFGCVVAVPVAPTRLSQTIAWWASFGFFIVCEGQRSTGSRGTTRVGSGPAESGGQSDVVLSNGVFRVCLREKKMPGPTVVYGVRTPCVGDTVRTVCSIMESLETRSQSAEPAAECSKEPGATRATKKKHFSVKELKDKKSGICMGLVVHSQESGLRIAFHDVAVSRKMFGYQDRHPTTGAPLLSGGLIQLIVNDVDGQVPALKSFGFREWAGPSPRHAVSLTDGFTVVHSVPRYLYPDIKSPAILCRAKRGFESRATKVLRSQGHAFYLSESPGGVQVCTVTELSPTWRKRHLLCLVGALAVSAMLLIRWRRHHPPVVA